MLFAILSQQRATFPEWLPFLGEDKFQLKAEFTTSQAVTPGQGQSVQIAGIRVGGISNVELVEGRAVVTMDIDPEYGELIREDATFLLRPRTGLQDMTIEIDTGADDGAADRRRARSCRARRPRPTSTRTRCSPRSTPTPAPS